MRRPPGHLMTGAGREEVLRKGGGEETRSVRCMCDVCGEREEERRREACDVCVMCVERIPSQPASSSEDRAGRRALGSGWLR
jgi:hypothetical protein